MASIWKRKSERRDPNAKWNITYTDENGERPTVVGCSDRRASEEIARKLESDVALKRRGVIDPAVERIVDAARVPIDEHVKAFIDFVRAQKPSGHAGRYLRQVEARVRAVIAFADISYLPDFTPDKLAAYVASMQKRECSGFTINEHVGSLKQFTKWAVLTNRLASDPLAATKKADASKLEKKRPRRALSSDEIGRLLSATLDRPLYELKTIRFGDRAGQQVAKVRPSVAAKAIELGRERMRAYLLALWTGLRRSELRQLQWGDVRLDTIPAKLALRAKTTKAKRADSIALHPQIANALKSAKPKSARPTDRVPGAVPGMKVLRADLGHAGVDDLTANGRIDLHAMRVSLGTFLASNGVPQRVAQAHLRHTDPRLTAGVYTDEALLPTAAAIAELPSLPTEPSKRLRATGTCNHSAPAANADSSQRATGPRAAPAQRAAHTLRHLDARGGSKAGIGAESGQSAQVHEKTGACAPVHANSRKRAKGLEPSTFTLAT